MPEFRSSLLLVRRGVVRPLALLLAVGAAVALFAVSEFAYVRSSAAMRQIDAVIERRQAVRAVQRVIADLETSQRAYLLSAGPVTLAAYRSAATTLDEVLRTLEQVYGDTPA